MQSFTLLTCNQRIISGMPLLDGNSGHFITDSVIIIEADDTDFRVANVINWETQKYNIIAFIQQNSTNWHKCAYAVDLSTDIPCSRSVAGVFVKEAELPSTRVEITKHHLSNALKVRNLMNDVYIIIHEVKGEKLELYKRHKGSLTAVRISAQLKLKEIVP